MWNRDLNSQDRNQELETGTGSILSWYEGTYQGYTVYMKELHNYGFKPLGGKPWEYSDGLFFYKNVSECYIYTLLTNKQVHNILDAKYEK